MTLASSWALGTNKEGQSFGKKGRSTVEVKGGSGNIITSFQFVHREKNGFVFCVLRRNDVYKMEIFEDWYPPGDACFLFPLLVFVEKFIIH